MLSKTQGERCNSRELSSIRNRLPTHGVTHHIQAATRRGALWRSVRSDVGPAMAGIDKEMEDRSLEGCKRHQVAHVDYADLQVRKDAAQVIDGRRHLQRRDVGATGHNRPPRRWPERASAQPHTMEPMNWNDAAEDFLNLVVAQTPRPVRETTEAELRALAESMAEEDGKNRVGVETVIAAWVRSTPETLRADLPRQMERYGLDPEDYRSLLE
jgi:hypothetical protein